MWHSRHSTGFCRHVTSAYFRFSRTSSKWPTSLLLLAWLASPELAVGPSAGSPYWSSLRRWRSWTYPGGFIGCAKGVEVPRNPGWRESLSECEKSGILFMPQSPPHSHWGRSLYEKCANHRHSSSRNFCFDFLTLYLDFWRSTSWSLCPYLFVLLGSNTYFARQGSEVTLLWWYLVVLRSSVVP